jgi:hypothetical protein
MIDHLRKTGITKAAMQEILTTKWSLSPDEESACEKYYILHWRGNHFWQVMTSGQIIHQNVRYLVVYKDCTPTQIKEDSKLFMSFRKPDRTFNLPAYVLVSVAI